MIKPFQAVVDSNRYNLRYTWGNNQVNIADCILKTQQQYGADGVSERDFDKMVSVLCTGASSSALACRRDPTIITQMCTSFPNFLNTKNVDNIIKCLTKQYYPQTCVESISKTGYVFTESQVKKLCSLGYMMLNLLDTMTYQEFLALFNNADFWNTFKQSLDVDYTESPDVIDAKIKTLKDIQDKFKFVTEPNFAHEMIIKCGWYYNSVGAVNSVLNIHIIADGLGMKFTPEYFKKIVEGNSKFYATGYDATPDYAKIAKIAKFYGEPINRDFILDSLTMGIDVFRGFLKPSLTSYDPMEDIFHITFKVANSLRSQYIQHMLDNNYLKYDNFLLFLMYIRAEDAQSELSTILKEFVKRNGMNIEQYYIENIFTFGNAKSINVLSDYKILPSIEYVKMIVGCETLKELRGTSLFLDDDTESYMDRAIMIHNNNDNDKGNISSDEFVAIYDSMSQRDQDIVIRLPIDVMMKVSTIVRYRITVTKTMVEYMLLRDSWVALLSLMYMSKDYDYIIEMLDIDPIMLAPSFHARSWMMEHIYNEGPESFAIPNKFFDLQKNVESDVKALLEKPIINQVSVIRFASQKLKEETRRRLMIEHLESQEESEPVQAPIPELVYAVAEKTVAAVPIVAPVAAAVKVAKYADDYVDDSDED